MREKLFGYEVVEEMGPFTITREGRWVEDKRVRVYVKFEGRHRKLSECVLDRHEASARIHELIEAIEKAGL